MNHNAQQAWDQLQAIGAPVLSPDLGWGGHFAISAEIYGRDDGYYEGHKDEAPDGMPWADYWTSLDPHESITTILDANDLFCEWVNPGVLAVYDI